MKIIDESFNKDIIKKKGKYMHLVVLWKENINLHLSIMDLKDRAEDNIFEDRWIEAFKEKIERINPFNKNHLLNHLYELELTKKAFKHSLKDLANDSDNILKKYDNFYCSNDETHILFKIDKGNVYYSLRLEEVFCIDNETIANRENAMKKSQEWIENKLVNFDIEVRDNNDKVIYAANEITEIDNKNKVIEVLRKELERDYKILKDYNEKTVAFMEYMKKREIIPEIISRTEGKDSLIKPPSENAVAAFSTILIEKDVLKLNTIGQYQNKYKLRK